MMFVFDLSDKSGYFLHECVILTSIVCVSKTSPVPSSSISLSYSVTVWHVTSIRWAHLVYFDTSPLALTWCCKYSLYNIYCNIYIYIYIYIYILQVEKQKVVKKRKEKNSLDFRSTCIITVVSKYEGTCQYRDKSKRGGSSLHENTFENPVFLNLSFITREQRQQNVLCKKHNCWLDYLQRQSISEWTCVNGSGFARRWFGVNGECTKLQLSESHLWFGHQRHFSYS